MIKRRYPMSFLIVGIILRLIRTYYVGIIIILLWLIGKISNIIFVKISLALSLAWIIYVIIDQLNIRKCALSQSDNEDFNKVLDTFFGAHVSSKGDNKDEEVKHTEG